MEFNWKTNKIKKVSPFNGTKVKQVDALKSGVRTTVYKAETQFYPGATPTILRAQYSPYTINDTVWTVRANNGSNVNSTTAYIVIDLTEIDILEIQGTIVNASDRPIYAGIYLATPAQFNSYKDNQLSYPYYVFFSPQTNVFTASSFAFPTYMDVRNYSGEYYFFVGGYCNNSGQIDVTVTSVKGYSFNRTTEHPLINSDNFVSGKSGSRMRNSFEWANNKNSGNYVWLSQWYNNGDWSSLKSVNKMNMSNYSKVRFTFWHSGSGGNYNDFALKVKQTDNNTDTVARYGDTVRTSSATKNTVMTMEWDISELNGEWYYGLVCYSTYSNFSYALYDIEFI